MSVERKILQWMGAALAAVLLHTTGAQAQALKVPLGAPDGFTASAVTSVGGNRYCISGSVYDDAGPSDSAMVLLVDAARGTVLWKKAIPHRHDYVSNSAVACAAAGDGFYVVTRENTHLDESENQSRLAVIRLSAAGTIEKLQVLELGFDEWFYGLYSDADGIAVVGGTSGSFQRNGPFGTFVVRFDPQFGAPIITNMKSGAFWIGSQARVDAQHLLVAGQFMPNPGGGRDAPAVSKIDLHRGRYVWSAYPLPDDTRSSRAWLMPDGGVVSVGLTPTTITVATTDANGKVGATFSGKKTLCTIDAVARSRNTLEAIGTTCDAAAKTAVLPIDLNARTLGAPRSLGVKLDAAGFDGQSWIGVSGGHGSVLQRGQE